MNANELFPIVDNQGNVIGKATRGECHGGSMLLHPVVHLHITTPNGSLYLQKRAMNKDIQPGKWDTSVGGHVDYGEPVEAALRREVSEELGLDITDMPVRFICRYEFKSSRERELVNVFALTVDAATVKPVPDPEEIDEGRFWSREEILNAIGKDLLTPNFESEYQRIAAQL